MLRAPEPARSVICGSASDPSAAPGEEPPSLSLLAQTTASFSPPTEAGSLILPLDQDVSHFLEWFCGCLPACILQLNNPSQPRRGRREEWRGAGGDAGGKKGSPNRERRAGLEAQSQIPRPAGCLRLDFPICTMGLHSFFSTNIYMPDLVLNALPSHHEDKTLP